MNAKQAIFSRYPALNALREKSEPKPEHIRSCLMELVHLLADKKPQRPMDLTQVFDSHSNCYADTRVHESHDTGEVIPAMTKDRFVEVVAKILRDFST